MVGLRRGGEGVEDRAGLDAVVDHEERERDEERQLAAGEVGHRHQLALLQHAEDHPAVEPERVGRREDHAGGREERHGRVHAEGAEQRQELADEAGGAGHADIAEGEHHEGERVERHPVHEAAVGGDLAGVQAVVDHADAEEERAGDQAVGDHLEHGALHALGRHGEQAHGHEAHMRHGGIGDELLHVVLHQGDEGGVDDGDDRRARRRAARSTAEASGNIGSEMRMKP